MVEQAATLIYNNTADGFIKSERTELSERKRERERERPIHPSATHAHTHSTESWVGPSHKSGRRAGSFAPPSPPPPLTSPPSLLCAVVAASATDL
jgi:hypothetical protein